MADVGGDGGPMAIYTMQGRFGCDSWGDSVGGKPQVATQTNLLQLVSTRARPKASLSSIASPPSPPSPASPITSMADEAMQGDSVAGETTSRPETSRWPKRAKTYHLKPHCHHRITPITPIRPISPPSHQADEVMWKLIGADVVKKPKSAAGGGHASLR